jgi:rubrerythrin
MGVRAALAVALVSETKAHAFFAAALPELADLEVRRLFEELRDEELAHQELVRRELARLPPESGVDPEAFVDEPVAQ